MNNVFLYSCECSEGQRELMEELHRRLSLKEAEAQSSKAEVMTLQMRIKDLEQR